jgi:hypothetical protein
MCSIEMRSEGQWDLEQDLAQGLATDTTSAKTRELALQPRLQDIPDAEYPRLSLAEMARRRTAVENLLAEFGRDHLVFCGATVCAPSPRLTGTGSP